MDRMIIATASLAFLLGKLYAGPVSEVSGGADAFFQCESGNLSRCIDVPRSHPNAEVAYKKSCKEGWIVGCLLLKLISSKSIDEKEYDALLAEGCEKTNRFFLIAEVLCPKRANPYDGATAEKVKSFHRSRVPFKPGTLTFVREGAFGRSDFHRNRYCWDFSVPYGTEVIAVNDGVVTNAVVSDETGCSPEYLKKGGWMEVLHNDGSVSRYAHVRSLVREGEKVRKNQVIALSDKTGWICGEPHIMFAKSSSAAMARNNDFIPLNFTNIDGGLAKTDHHYTIR